MGYRGLFLLVGLALLAGGCASQTMYHWGKYEPSLYKYYKNPDSLEKYAEALEKLIEKGQRTDRVPPGLFAEYGQVLNTLGKSPEAIKYFELEKQAWPESTHLMDMMIQNASKHGSAAAGQRGNG